MFRFEHPYYLMALILIFVLVASQFVVNKMQAAKLNRLAHPNLWRSLVPGFDHKLLRRRSWFWLGGMALVLFSLSNPQWGVRKEKIEIKSTDIFICQDISNSMLSEDIKPNRLERSKLWAESLIRSLASDRVGVVLFAGNAFLQSPLTTDYGAATMFIRSAHPELITTQGTSIGDAIQVCMDNFGNENEAQKVILLLTDGEDQDENAMAIARKAKEKNIGVFTIGIGTPEGGLIPILIHNASDYKRDETGKPIQTKLNAKFLQELAGAAQGKYFWINDGEAIVSILKDEIANMTKQRVAERSYSEYESYFPYFLFPGLILLLIEYLMSIRWFERLKKKNAVLAIAAGFLFLSPTVFSQSEHQLLKKADQSYTKQDFNKAEETYRRALETRPNEIIKYNLGNSIMEQNRPDEAIGYYEDATKKKDAGELNSDAWFNLGNAYFQKKEYQKSINAYKESLKRRPEDIDAKKNLVLAKKQLIKQQQQQQQNQEQNKKDQPQNQPQQQNQQQQQNNQDKKEKLSSSQQQQPPSQQGQEQQAAQQQGLTKQEADQLLQYSDREDQRVQQKLVNKKTKPNPPKKDW